VKGLKWDARVGEEAGRNVFGKEKQIVYLTPHEWIVPEPRVRITQARRKPHG
jgi:hypothetical protein